MRKIFHNDTVIRVVSVLISILLWMYVVGVNNPTVSVLIKAVPIRTTNSAEFDKSGLKVISKGNESVDVKIEGRHSDVSKISASDILAQIDVSKITKPGKYELEIALNTKSGVTFTNITASKTEVFADYVVSVNKDIVVETTGEPKEGFLVSKVEQQDKQVIVRGPKSLVDKIKGAVVKFDVSGADGTLSKNCSFSIVDKSGKDADLTFVTTNITETVVNVNLTHEKEVEIVPSFENTSLISGYDVKITPSIIKIVGDADAVKTISKIETDLIKLPEDLNEQKVITLDAVLTMPEKVSILNGTAGCKVTLTLKE